MATNYPELLDKAVVRKGRMDKHIEIPFPDEKGILAILDKKLEKMFMKLHSRTLFFIR